MKLLIANGHLIDPIEGQNSGKNLLIENGKVAAWLGQNESAPEDAEILVRGQVLKGMKPEDEPVVGKKNEPMQPVVWVRNYKNESGKTNKIVTTTMGSSTDLQNEGLRRLLVNASYWAVGLPVPEKADVSYVCEFKPLMYGFDGFKKGVKPSEHELK